jgi:hypothetical protein
MSNRGKKRFISLFLISCILTSGITVSATIDQQHSQPIKRFYSDGVIRQGLAAVNVQYPETCPLFVRFALLETWLNANPFVDYARFVGTSITVKFIDGSYTVLLDPFPTKTPLLIDSSMESNNVPSKSLSGPSAVLLNPDEYVYGHRQCQQIITTLLQHDYSIHYLANDAVTLSYLRYNLSANIIYMNTHAGFFDTDGDQQADAVVIATGEPWTNDTEQTYSFEYGHHMIVKGMIGNISIIAFTPAFIDYYYPAGSLPDSLVYMATCFATYDASMAQAFLDAGASAYIGWSANTVFWTNSKISVQAFHLLASGLSVHQVSSLVRSGGFFNRLFHSKLLYYGNGEYHIPR